MSWEFACCTVVRQHIRRVTIGCMPKVVDHEQRKVELAAAVWRIVTEGGVAALSVRRVGEVAGWSGGAVQYYFPTKAALLNYFPTKAALLTYAFDLVTVRTLDRFAQIAESALDRDVLRATIIALLPTTAEICTETEIWFAFLGLAIGEPTLRTAAESGHLQVIAGVRAAVKRSQAAGIVDAGLDPELITTDLVALCDGLCVQELYRPWELSVAGMEAIVDQRLAAITPRRGRPVSGSATRRTSR